MRNIISYRDLVLYQVYANLRSEAKRYCISYFWWIINPVLDMTVLYVVFGLLFQRPIENFVPFLLIGIVSWRWMATSVTRSANSLLENSLLINQVDLPKVIIPTIIMLTETFKFFVAFGILLFFLSIYGLHASIHYSAILFVLFTEFLFITGLSYFFAAVTPFYRDIQILLQNAFQLLFFLSGIFYKIEFIPPSLRPLFRINPMVNIIESLRAVLLYNNWPSLQSMAYVFFVSISFIFVSLKILCKFEKIYPRIVMS